jgi:signal transduction histidine kinase
MMEAGASPASFRAPAKSLQAVYGWLIARGGNIEVMVEEGRSMIEVKIIDSGIGIPDASMSRIFDRFYRAALSISKGRARDWRLRSNKSSIG